MGLAVVPIPSFLREVGLFSRGMKSNLSPALLERGFFIFAPT